MTPNDVTQPMQPHATPEGAWPPHAILREQQRGPTGRRGWLWVALAFVIGCALTAVVALVALAPSPAPSVPAQTDGAALKMTITDTLLTTALNANQGTSLSGVTLTQARAHIQANGEIVISGVLQGTPAFSGATVTVVAQPYVSQNTLAIRLLRSSIAGFTLPPAALNVLRDQVNARLAESSHVSLGVGQGLVVSGVSFTDGAMTLTYAPAGA